VKGKDIPVRLALCIIHCAMRTMESCLRSLLDPISEKFLSGSDTTKRSVTRLLNNRLYRDLGVRPLVTASKPARGSGAKAHINEVTLNGNEVRALMKDCAQERSVLFDAVRETCTEHRPCLVRLAAVVDLPLPLQKVRVLDAHLARRDGGLPETEQWPQWQSGMALARMYVIGASRRHLKTTRRAGSEFYGKLEQERQAYYAPCACELTEGFWKMPLAQQQKDLQRARKLRWAARTAAGQWIGSKPRVNYGAWCLKRSAQEGRWVFA